jgi:hypothetical protein
MNNKNIFIKFLIFLLFLFQYFHWIHSKIIVHKSILNNNLSKKEDIIFSLKIFNLGESPIYDVKTIDNILQDKKFELLGGLINSKWEKIPAGSNVTNMYVVKPLFSGNFIFEPTKIEYKELPNGPIQIAYSNSEEIFIENHSFYEKSKEIYLKEWITFGLLCSIPILPTFFVWYRIPSIFHEIEISYHNINNKIKKKK